MIDANDYAAGLNQHGYALQHRVVDEIMKLHHAAVIPWSVAGVEIPVTAGGKATRIDIALQSHQDRENRRYLVLECKRVNPAFSAWCFARSNHAFPSWLQNQVCGERARRVQRDDKGFETGGFGMAKVDCIYDIAFVLSSGSKGDPHPVSRDNDAVEAACVQAVSGMNGLVNLILHDTRYFGRFPHVQYYWFLPVVVTTADLYVAHIDFADVDIATGSATASDLYKVPWLIHQYPTSPQLKHNVNRGALPGEELEAVIARDYWRSVAVVNALSLKEFLQLNLLADM